MQYLNAVLWDSYHEEAQDDGPEVLLTPKISVISETWQRDVCEKLGLEFHSIIRHSTNIVGELCGYESSMTENIVGDGNCL